MVQHSWLQVLVLVNKDTRSSSTSVAASEAVSFLQLLTVPIAVALELARRFPGAPVQATLPELLFGLSVVNPDSVKQVFGETVFLVLFAVALMSVTSFVVMAIVVAVTVASKSAKHSPYLLRTLRATAKLSSTSLFLPWTSMLLQSLGCDKGVWWGGAGVECYGPLHISIAVVVLLLLPFFIGASLSVASVYIDRVPTSSQLDSRTHGRADVLLLVIKMGLTATLTYGTASAPEWVLVGILALSGGLWLVLFLTMVPFSHLVMNSAHVGMATSFLWASLCAAIVWASEGAQDVGLLVLLGTPIAGLLGFASAYMYFYKVLTIHDPYSMTSMWMIVLWTRERLRAAHTAKRRQEAMLSNGVLGVEMPPSAQAGKWGIKPCKDGETWFSVLEASAVSGIEALEDLFASVGIAHSIASTFYKSTTQLSHYKERQALTTARAVSRAFDIDFFFFQGLEDMHSGAGTVKGDPNKHTMSVVDRVLFDQHKVTALEAQADCYAVHVMLMKHVSGRAMDIGFLHAELGAQLDDAMRRAAKAFDAMLRINPESPEALAYAADFQLQLAGNTAVATDLLLRAQRVEENNRRIKERTITTLGFNAPADDDLSPSDEQNASFIISTDRATLGEIISVNTAAVRIFGSSNMLGSNINIIIPRPISDIHDSLLATFSQTGTSKFLDSTRVLVAQHSAGHLFPARFRILETPPSADDMRPRLTGLIAPLTADESFLIVGDESFDFSILSVCLKTASTLQRPVDALSDQGIHAAIVFPELFGSAGQGGMVDAPYPVPGPGQSHGKAMRRADSNASSVFGAADGMARRRQGHGVRPGSARSAAGSVFPGGHADDAATTAGDEGGGSGNPHSRLPHFLDAFPAALRNAYAGPTRVNLFVPALLHDEDFDGAESDDAVSVDEFPHGACSPKAARGGAIRGLQTGLSCVEESEEPSDGGGGVAAGWGEEDDDQDPATMRVEPQVIPVIVRCYALPKRHPAMASGIFIAWTRADAAGRPGVAGRPGPSSQWGAQCPAFAQPGATRAGGARGFTAASVAGRASMPGHGEPAEPAEPKKRAVMFASSANLGSSADDDSDEVASPPQQALSPGYGPVGVRQPARHGGADPSESVTIIPVGAASPFLAKSPAAAGATASASSRPRAELVRRAAAMAGKQPDAVSAGSPAVGATAVSFPGGSTSGPGPGALARVPEKAFGGDEETVEQSTFRRTLKRVLDIMTRGASGGVTLMRRVLWATTLVFIVLVAVTLSALGPWADSIKRHVSGLRHAGQLIELLHESHMVVQVLATEQSVRAAGHGGWPVTDLNATWTQLLRLPDRMDETVTEYFSDIQTVGGPLLAKVLASDAVVVKTETVTGSRALKTAAGQARAPGHQVVSSSSIAATPGRHLASEQSNFESMSLFEALQSCQQALQDLSEQPFLSFSESDPSAAFLLANARGAIGGAVNDTLLDGILTLGHEINDIEYIELLTFIVVMAVTIAGQLMLSMYASRNLWREQIALMQIFYEIPGKLAAALASRAELKLRKHRRQTVGAMGEAAHDGGGLDEDSDDSAERQREEGEEIRWQLMVERMSRVAQQDWAQEQAASHGVSVQRYLGSRRATRSSIQLDALPQMAADSGLDGGAGGAAAGGGGRRWSRRREGTRGEGGGRRSSSAGRMGHSHKGDVRIRATMLKERREGVRTGDPSCTSTMILLVNLAPSLLIAAWFMSVYVMDIAMHNRVTIDSQRLVHIQQQSIWADKLSHSVADSAFLPSARANATTLEALLSDATLQRAALTRRGSLVEHGGVSHLAELLRSVTGRESVALDPLPAYSPMQHIIHDDACPAVLFGVQGTYYMERSIVTAETCQTAHKGVMARGFSVSTSRLRSLTRAVDFSFRRLWAAEAAVARANANATWAAEAGVSLAELQRETAQYDSEAQSLAGQAVRLYDPWIRATMLSLEQDIVTSVEADIGSTWAGQRDLTIGFVAAFLLAVVVIFAPRLTWVERIVTATRRMLLVIPDEVLVGFPRIAESVREMEQALEARASLAATLGSTARKREAAIQRTLQPRGHHAITPASASTARPARSSLAPHSRVGSLLASESHGSMGSKVLPYMDSMAGDSSGSTRLTGRLSRLPTAGPGPDLTEVQPENGTGDAGTEFKAIPGGGALGDSETSPGTESKDRPHHDHGSTMAGGGTAEGGEVGSSHRGSLVMSDAGAGARSTAATTAGSATGLQAGLSDVHPADDGDE